MKKIISVAVAAVFAFASFVGCTQNTDFTSVDAVGEKNATVALTDGKDGTIGAETSYGTVELDSEGAMKITCGSWMKAKITPEKPIYCKDATITIEAKFGDDFKNESVAQGWGDLKVELYTTDALGNEINYVADKEATHGMFTATNISTEYTKYSFNTSDMWTAYGLENSAYLPYITKIVINPQASVGSFYIKSFTVKNAE